MTIAKLNRILKENNIPEDATLMSDSGWECCATDMDGVYYRAEDNTVVFTQDYDNSFYNSRPDWVKLELKGNEDNYIWLMGARTKRKIMQEISIIYGDTLTNLYGIEIHYDHNDHDALRLYKNIKED